MVYHPDQISMCECVISLKGKIKGGGRRLVCFPVLKLFHVKYCVLVKRAEKKTGGGSSFAFH